MPNSPREEIIKERLARYGVKPSRYADWTLSACVFPAYYVFD